MKSKIYGCANTKRLADGGINSMSVRQSINKLMTDIYLQDGTTDSVNCGSALDWNTLGAR